MGKRIPVQVTVISQKGTCAAGHKVGDKWVLIRNTPSGLCMAALAAIWPEARAIMLGGKFPWAKEDGSITIACADADNPVVFELKPLPPVDA